MWCFSCTCCDNSCMHLCVEDWRWWWKSFFASGSVSLYVFLYSINYLVFDLRSLSGPVSTTLFLGYSVLMVLAIMLATGTIGFLTSFWFVHFLFSSVKIDWSRENKGLLGGFKAKVCVDGYLSLQLVVNLGWCWWTLHAVHISVIFFFSFLTGLWKICGW